MRELQAERVRVNERNKGNVYPTREAVQRECPAHLECDSAFHSYIPFCPVIDHSCGLAT
jgi:hypothetical protein